MYANILGYRSYYYLKVAGLLVLLALVLYVTQPSAAEPPNGSTWLGYALGGASLAIMFFLLWFGIRKRQYHCTASHLAGWASAHVYLGGALIIIATLHCGFQFGWNVHTLAYGLLLVVSLSGFYGLYSYLTFPTTITENRRGLSRRELVGNIAVLDEQSLNLAATLDEQLHQLILLTVESTCLGHIRPKLMAAGADSDSLPDVARRWLASYDARTRSGAAEPPQRSSHDRALDFLNHYFGETHSADLMKRAAELLGLLKSRQELVAQVQRDVRYHFFMRSWLYVHVPCSIALLAAVTVHVVSVFFYW